MKHTADHNKSYICPNQKPNIMFTIRKATTEDIPLINKLELDIHILLIVTSMVLKLHIPMVVQELLVMVNTFLLFGIIMHLLVLHLLYLAVLLANLILGYMNLILLL